MMKKDSMLIDVILVIGALAIVCASAIGFLMFDLKENTMYIISGITIAVAIVLLYIRNYKNSSYGGKFKDRYPDAK